MHEYIINIRVVLTIFSVILQTVINVIMLSIGLFKDFQVRFPHQLQQCFPT